MQVVGIYKPFCVVKARGMKLDCKIFSGNIDRPCCLSKGIELEHICCDPKDSELYLGRLKPGESLVEDRSNSDGRATARPPTACRCAPS